MIIHFPNQQALQLALTSGVVPAKVSLAPAKARFGDDGTVWVQPAGTISRSVATALGKLGAKLRRRANVDLDQEATCWPQLLPVARRAESPAVGQQTPVLFELFSDRQLPELVNEVLRQGNDRQGFRFLTGDAKEKSLLRVIGPPYYSLLRALDRHKGDIQPRAYVEQNARVWVELGYEHPLATRIQPAAGKWLLMRPTHDWTFVDEAPFRDVYEVLDFALPTAKCDWEEAKLAERISVPLRLSSTRARESAELWVLQKNGLDQVERLVRNADDLLVSQLAFAVAGSGDERTIVLRARPSRKAPPVLVLEGIGFRSYLKLPNLFLPVGRRLHPPLRRDAVARLFQQDRSRVTWLYPEEDGAFAPQSIDEDAFRPLTDWVDYVIDQSHEPLKAWVASYQFEFESFICADDKPARTGKPPKRPEQPAPTKRTADAQSDGVKARDGRETEAHSGEEISTRIQVEGKKPEPSELQLRLRQLEKRYLDSTKPLDALERSRWWREMAAANGLLRHRHDATVCWSNGLWEEKEPSAALLNAWMTSEKEDESATSPENNQLADWIADPTTSANASKVAAYLVRAANQDGPAGSGAELGSVSQYLERQESCLPIRTAWLAWLAMARLTHGDVLALARARDRLLERLYQHGLRPEFDLPTFLRATGSGDTDRFRVVRQHVLKIHDVACEWIVEPPSGRLARTGAYVDLLFSFALARLGESAESERLRTRADEALQGQDPVHRWLRSAFGQRIEQALAGTTTTLEPTLMEKLAALDRMDRYKVDRLRQHSHILEPHERIDPYRRWHRRYEDDLSRQLAELHDVTNRDELRDRIANFMRQTKRAPTDAVRVLSTSLELAPRLGEASSLDVLERVVPTLQVTQETVERALLLGRGMLVAAHYGAIDHVRAFVGQFEALLLPIVTTFLTVGSEHRAEDRDKVDTLETLFTGSFRGLRRLGMRDEVGHLFGEVAGVVDQQVNRPRRSRTKNDPDREKVRVRARRLMLTMAGGWYYFGQNEQATRVVEDVRTVLFQGDAKAVEQKNLACAYISAVGQAPPEMALPSILELFEKGKNGRRKLPGIEDAMTTSTHFSISQLDLVEAVVLALVSDDFSLTAERRRWLDEDEFLVRRRIHRDVQQAMQ